MGDATWGRWCDQHHAWECEAQRKGNGWKDQPGPGPGPCHGRVIPGSKPGRCAMHIRKTTHAKAHVRAAVARWDVDTMTTLDPGETLLRLMTVAWLRAEQHADELDAILAKHGWHDTFVGDIASEFGKVGEYAKQLAVWEAQERKHAADLAVKAVAAGLEERRVKAAERYAEAIAGAVEAALAAAGVEGDALDAGRHGAERYLRTVESS